MELHNVLLEDACIVGLRMGSCRRPSPMSRLIVAEWVSLEYAELGDVSTDFIYLAPQQLSLVFRCSRIYGGFGKKFHG
jgi:hypothetical protein